MFFKKLLIYSFIPTLVVAGGFLLLPSQEIKAESGSQTIYIDGYAISQEFGGSSNQNPDPADDVSGEGQFETDSSNGQSNSDLSGEGNFTTDGEIDSGDEEVSGEGNFTTGKEDDGDGGHQFSDEFNFTTADDGQSGEDPVISGESTFTTLESDGGDTEPTVSGEFSFTTTDGGGNGDDGDLVVSGELSFTTSNGGGGGGGSGGGGSSGGGGRARDRDIVKDELPDTCQPYLLEFIRIGEDNNPDEVKKLQTFLNEYEGFDLEVDGVYKAEDLAAVHLFQLRHADDVLDPWGIGYSTGYVYITTSLKINFIVCGIDDPITLDLRDRIDIGQFVPAAVGEIDDDGVTPIEPDEDGGLPDVGVATSTDDEDNGQNIFQLAALGILDFFEGLFDEDCWWCWLVILILLLIIGYLSYRNRKIAAENRRLNNHISTASSESYIGHNDSGQQSLPTIDYAEEGDQAVGGSAPDGSDEEIIEMGPETEKGGKAKGKT